MTPDLMEAGAQRFEKAAQAAVLGQTESGGRSAGYGRGRRAYQPLAASALAILLRGTVGLGTLKSNQLRTSSSTPMPCMKL